jgi:hypothetical protein
VYSCVAEGDDLLYASDAITLSDLSLPQPTPLAHRPKIALTVAPSSAPALPDTVSDLDDSVRLPPPPTHTDAFTDMSRLVIQTEDGATVDAITGDLVQPKAHEAKSPPSMSEGQVAENIMRSVPSTEMQASLDEMSVDVRLMPAFQRGLSESALPPLPPDDSIIEVSSAVTELVPARPHTPLGHVLMSASVVTRIAREQEEAAFIPLPDDSFANSPQRCCLPSSPRTSPEPHVDSSFRGACVHAVEAAEDVASSATATSLQDLFEGSFAAEIAAAVHSPEVVLITDASLVHVHEVQTSTGLNEAGARQDIAEIVTDTSIVAALAASQALPAFVLVPADESIPDSAEAVDDPSTVVIRLQAWLRMALTRRRFLIHLDIMRMERDYMHCMGTQEDLQRTRSSQSRGETDRNASCALSLSNSASLADLLVSPIMTLPKHMRVTSDEEPGVRSSVYDPRAVLFASEHGPVTDDQPDSNSVFAPSVRPQATASTEHMRNIPEVDEDEDSGEWVSGSGAEALGILALGSKDRVASTADGRSSQSFFQSLLLPNTVTSDRVTNIDGPTGGHEAISYPDDDGAEGVSVTSERMLFHGMATAIQSVWRGYQTRCDYNTLQSNRRAAAYSIQHWYKQMIDNRQLGYGFSFFKSAIERFQAIWRGARVRAWTAEMHPAIHGVYLRVQNEEREMRSGRKKTLGTRTAAALIVLARARSLHTIMPALADLEVASRLSPRCCAAITAVSGPPALYALMRCCGRDQGHLFIVRKTLAVLRNISFASEGLHLPLIARSVEAVPALIDVLQMYRDRLPIVRPALDILENIVRFSARQESQKRARKSSALPALLRPEIHTRLTALRSGYVQKQLLLEAHNDVVLAAGPDAAVILPLNLGIHAGREGFTLEGTIKAYDRLIARLPMLKDAAKASKVSVEMK